MSAAKTPLARLEPVDARTIWPNEAQDFTPWLAEEENLALLGETLGMEIERSRIEVPVGSFSADIVAVDTADNSKILIENQLAKTDHTHLGQILTYAAGLDALTVVWIATEFTAEHQAALEWLNSITGPDIRFFGLEIEVWKIEESRPAPKFNVVAKPNTWTKAFSTAKPDLTEVQQAQLAFWRGFQAYAKEHASKITPTSPKPQNWMALAIGRTGFGLSAVASSWSEGGSPEIRAEFWVSGDDAERRFEAIREQREQIEREVGVDNKLEWRAPENTKSRSIRMCRQINWLNDSSRHEECYAWLVEKLDLLYDVFHDRVRELP